MDQPIAYRRARGLVERPPAPAPLIRCVHGAREGRAPAWRHARVAALALFAIAAFIQPAGAETPPTVTPPGNQSTFKGTNQLIGLGSFSDPDGGFWLVDVNWGDSSLDTVFTKPLQGSLGAEPHAYAHTGTFTVTETVTDAANGAPGIGTFQITVTNPGPTVTPAGHQTASAGSLTSFSLGSFSDSEGGTFAVDIGWGDGSPHTTLSIGTTGPLPTQSHPYAAPGTYTVTVTVTDSTSLSGSATFVVTVTKPPPVVSPPPVPGTPNAILQPLALDFGSLAVGSKSDVHNVLLRSTGTAPLLIISIAIEGANPNDFAIVSGGFGGTLAEVQTRPIGIVATPQASGTRSAMLHVVTNDAGSPRDVLLSATSPPEPPPRITVGEAVAHGPGIEFYGADPPGADSRDVTSLRGLSPDGSLFLQDWAGTSILRVPPGGAPAVVLVDTSTPAPPDGVGIARIVRSVVSPNGTVGLIALRADNNRGIYRLANGSLTLLGILAGPRGVPELAIGDAGQLAYLANVDPTNPASPLALYQAGNGAPVELVRQGQPGVNGTTVATFSDLTGNSSGNLSIRVSLNGTPNQAVLRFTPSGVQVVAKSGDVVEKGRGTGMTGALTELRGPGIGPEGSDVFLAAGSDFVNFFVARPGRPLEALLAAPGTDLSILNESRAPSPSAGHRFDYEIAADGTVALQSAQSAADYSLQLIAPTGSVTPVVSGQRAIEPILRPVFGPGGLLFFQAEDQTHLTDRSGQFQNGLYRFRPGGTGPEPVAMPGDHIPGWSSDTRLLSLTQRPVVAGNSLFFGAVFGGPESYPVPTGALFQVPLTGTLADNGVPVVTEGYAIAGESHVARLTDLSYQLDGTLGALGLMTGGGPLLAPAPAAAQTQSLFRTQAAPPAAGIVPLVADGDGLGGGELRAIVPPLVAVGTDRELFGARTSQTQVPDHEGLFTVSVSGNELVARNRGPVPDRSGTFFNGFADTRFADTLGLPDRRLFTLSPSSVGPDGRLVFKSAVDRGGPPAGGQLPLFGIFQWSSGGAPATIGLSDDALVAGDRLPYVLDNWAAGPGGVSYLLARTDGGKGAARLLKSSAGARPTPLLGPGTPVTGGTPLTDVTDFVLNRDGDLFVAGTTAGGAGVFRAAGGSLALLAAQGMPVPSFADGTPTTGFTFAGSFQLLPSTARWTKLLFRAMVQKPGSAARLGEFEWSANSGLQTRSIVGVAVNGLRTLTADMLGDTTLELQNGNGTAVSAYLSDQGSWVIVRSRVVGGSIVSEPIAQEGKGTDPKARRFVVLDAGPLLDEEGLPPHNGPVFTLNDAGEVAILASDGKRWGIYAIPP
jgi:PKD repeat protein